MTPAESHSDRPSLFPQPRRRDCPHCGANCWDDDKTCWHCHRRLDGAPVRPQFAQFSIGMILVATTSIAVALATFRWFPLLTVLIFLWIAPALLHTYLACRILRHRVPAVDFGERMDRFGLALVYVLPALVVALIGTVLPAALLLIFGFPRYTSFISSLIVSGAMVGLPLGGWIFWLTLPRPPQASS